MSPINRLVSAIVRNYKLRRLDAMVKKMKKRLTENCVEACIRHVERCYMLDCPLLKIRKNYEERNKDVGHDRHGHDNDMRGPNKGQR